MTVFVQLVPNCSKSDIFRSMPSNLHVLRLCNNQDQVKNQKLKMEYNAWAYDELSKPQIEAGCKFINELNLSVGNKVLDMGCGTGNITKYVADIVGSDGQVVGIDPDVARASLHPGKAGSCKQPLSIL